ncbi:PTS system D-mannitol-specific IIA, IIB, IIC components Fru family [Brachyspira pilosicoli B2904]|uniref:protein-N(pi)-phosphohistidine--D-mannitol phosphotransferase n=1 Tax=Brachyspira pilosicoli B2904 TaxID=1133568 RepID=J9UXX6_BRAPL|nr:PTS mannitol transporter subunit IICBA [Brachyspira pilosicoli]AFR71773.1 PTS system D-mannitol-specific IIA, IIB, IIC components Fru family [Brachyspira pilosicoli B2904]
MKLDKVQKFGRYLSNMVQPNIAAFIAWGLITAFFIPTGWFPNETLNGLVSPILTYLLPILIAYSGGNMVYGHRGGVVGSIMAAGVIVGSNIPMFLGAMITGPLGAFLIKKLDELITPKIPTGFEMLVNNFSAGILGMILAIISLFIIGPVVEAISSALSSGVQVLVDLKLLPLVSILVEPAKVFFLNNAINHGVFSPIGIQQVTEAGKSIFFTIETNPGPGLGVLLAYTLFGKGRSKATAPGAAIIHFFGGIHEIYFPYILMNPILILALIVGGMSGVLTTLILKGGLIAVPAPGSIIAMLAVTPKGGFLATISSVVVATVVTFLVASIFVKRAPEEDLEEAIEKSKANKITNKTSDDTAKEEKTNDTVEITEISFEDAIKKLEIKKIVVACDAGMGSSAMGATVLKKIAKEKGLDTITIVNSAISNLDNSADIIITQKSLTNLAKEKMPNKIHLSINNFMDKNFYNEIVDKIKEHKK